MIQCYKKTYVELLKTWFDLFFLFIIYYFLPPMKTLYPFMSKSICNLWKRCFIFSFLDFQLAEVGGLPDDVLDLWEVTGKRPEAKFTWDSRRNENISIDTKFRPCHRFDRLYLRHAKPKPKVKPVYFELIGIEKIPTCQRFPSDHWGLLAHFDITQFTWTDITQAYVS